MHKRPYQSAGIAGALLIASVLLWREADAGGFAREQRQDLSTRAEGPSGKPADVRVVRGNGYAVDLTLEQQYKFKDSALAFQGKVVGVLPARYIASHGIELVYTPVVVRIARVFRGNVRPGQEIAVRAFGGTANGVTFEADFVPSSEILSKGVELIVIGPEPIVTKGDEPMSAMTPNGIHVVRDDAVIDATHHDEAGNRPERVRSLADAERALGSRN
ncbi:MAG: hypothetical protein RLZZ450_6799 [Pseudomonadota bacterium]|jgi:hypothetical protein